MIVGVPNAGCAQGRVIRWKGWFRFKGEVNWFRKRVVILVVSVNNVRCVAYAVAVVVCAVVVAPVVALGAIVPYTGIVESV